MDRGLIDSFEIEFKSAFRNLKSAILICAMLLALCVPAQAQQPAKIPRIGLLVPGSQSAFSNRTDAFRQGLRELGYVEGQNIAIEYRYTEGKTDRLPDLATEMVGLKVDVIVTASVPPVQAAKKASSTIPIIFASVNDPVAAGLVDSLARPGGNITGLTNFSPDLDGKRLELLKESFPKITRVAYLWNPDAPGTGLTAMQAAASGLGVQLQSLEARTANDLDSAFEAALRERVNALITLPTPSLLLIKSESWTSRQGAGCRRYIRLVILRTQAV